MQPTKLLCRLSEMRSLPLTDVLQEACEPTRLHLATLKGDLKQVTLLLEHGAPVDAAQEVSEWIFHARYNQCECYGQRLSKPGAVS